MKPSMKMTSDRQMHIYLSLAGNDCISLKSCNCIASWRNNCRYSSSLRDFNQRLTSREVQQHMRQIGTLGSQFMQHSVRNQLDWQLNVSQCWPKSNRNQGQQRLQRSNMETRDLWPQRYIFPQTRIVSNLSPTFAHSRHTTYFQMW